MDVPKEVLDELEKRINRLQAIIEIAERKLPASQQRPVPKPPSSFPVYLWTGAAWVIGGLLILLFLRSRYGETLSSAPTGVSMAVYLVLALGVTALLLAYYFSQRKKQEDVLDIDEMARSAKRLLKEFYFPLREALKSNDRDSLRAIADKLLEDPLLAKAMDVLHEGNPKLCAYALYLYVSKEAVNEEDIEEALQELDNKPLRKLLITMLDGRRV